MKTILKTITAVALILSAQSCYKLKDKETIRGTITCTNINDNTGVSGVKYAIIEEKLKKSGPEYVTFLEGETDDSGMATFEFERPRNNKWGYTLTIDENSFPDGLQDTVVTGYYWLNLYNLYGEDRIDNYENNDVEIHFY